MLMERLLLSLIEVVHAWVLWPVLYCNCQAQNSWAVRTVVGKKRNILVNEVLHLVKITLAILTYWFSLSFFFLSLYSWCVSISSKENSLSADEEPGIIALQLYPRIMENSNVLPLSPCGALVSLITSSKLEYWTKFFYITGEGLLYHNDPLWAKSKNDAI